MKGIHRAPVQWWDKRHILSYLLTQLLVREVFLGSRAGHTPWRCWSNPQLSNRLPWGLQHTGSLQALQSSHREWTLSALPRKIWHRISLATIPVSCLSFWPNERCTTLWQTYPALRKKNTTHKDWLATTVTRGAVCDELRQVEPNHFSTEQARDFTLFFFLRFPKEGHLHQARLPAGKGASAATQQSQRQHSSRGIACRLFAVWSHLAQANIKIFCF